MQLHTQARNEVVSNVAQRQDFTIKASAKAFAILSDNLYRNKIAAPIRELSCNALDAHVMAGNSDPFVVHLPTQLEPYFSVEDKGTGMTPDQITDLYTSYFSSSKADRNDQIGALGLGSKSPFAYTDTFSVESVCQGLRSVYSAVIGASGTPSIILLHQEASDHHSGVKVMFPVKERDFSDFCYEAARVFWAFDKKPAITGAVKKYNEITSENRMGKVSLSGRGWTLYKEYPDFWSTRHAYVRMGNVLYPLSFPDAVSAKLADYEMYYENMFVLDMPIGACDIAPSREELSYDDLTVANLRLRFDEIVKDFDVSLTETLSKCNSPWTAAKAAYDFFSNLRLQKKRYGATQSFPFMFKGKSYTYWQELKLERSYTKIYQTCRRGRDVLNVLSILDGKTDPLTVHLGGKSFIVIEPTGKVNWNAQYAKSRLKLYLESKNISIDSVTVYVVPNLSKIERSKLLNIPVVNYVDFPKPQMAKKTADGTAAIKYTSWLQDTVHTDNPLNIRQGKTTFYIISNKKEYYLSHEDFTKYNHIADSKHGLGYARRYLRNTLNKMGFGSQIMTSVVIVSARDFKKYNLMYNMKWKPVTVLFQNLANVLQKKARAKYIAHTASHSVRDFYSAIINSINTYTELANQVGETSPFKKMIETLTNFAPQANADKWIEAYSGFKDTMEYFSGTCPAILQAFQVGQSSGDELDSIKMYERYPLLALMFKDRWNDIRQSSLTISPDAQIAKVSFFDGALSYIKMVDASNVTG